MNDYYLDIITVVVSQLKRFNGCTAALLFGTFIIIVEAFSLSLIV